MIADALCVRGIEVVHILDTKHSVVHPMTSAARVVKVANEAEEGVDVIASTYLKCERCWHYRADVGASSEHPGLCGRCITNLFGNGETRSAA